jgi:hypothetical protein
VNLDTMPAWADPVGDPFRRDPSFWRAVYASADALVLIAVAAVSTALLNHAGAGPLLAMAPFLLPLAFVAVAVASSYRSSRASRVWFRRHGDDATWRDSERRAVASVFVRALVRNRLTYP